MEVISSWDIYHTDYVTSKLLMVRFFLLLTFEMQFTIYRLAEKNMSRSFEDAAGPQRGEFCIPSFE